MAKDPGATADEPSRHPTLFGYSVEDHDGKLVITVEGLLAAEALQGIHAALGSGALPLTALLSPLEPLRQLLSAQVSLTGGVAGGVAITEDTERLLTQKVEQTLTEFQEQLGDFRRNLDAVKREQRAESG